MVETFQQLLPQTTPIHAVDSNRQRHAPRQQLHHEDRVGKEPNKFLFLRDATSTPSMVYRIACPDCGRSDFPRLQGLLNHCRLKHHREFGSHDECVQACAVVVPEEDQSTIVMQGLEITGMSASLRRLFEMAVGSYAGIVMGSAEGMIPGHVPQETDEDFYCEQRNIITSTLGHHKDTPALAPFLGRGFRKREIKIVDTEDQVDIISLDGMSQRPRWTMCYGERSRAVDIVTDDSAGDSELENGPGLTSLSESQSRVQASSRFHITSRLIIADWSLRVSSG